MPPPATPSADIPAEAALDGRAARAASTWRTLARHQVGSVAATAVDFGVMIGCVELLGAAPTAATAVGALFGAAANFTLGRAWIFRRHAGRLRAQVVRYAIVSAASAGWNVVGEHVAHDLAHLPYVFARAVVAIAVSLLWNFPLQRAFVFHEGPSR